MLSGRVFRTGGAGRSVNWSYLYLSFDGRISRQPFWAAFLVIAGIELACHLLVSPLENGPRLSSIVSLAFVYPEFALFTKRGHDRNISPRVIAAFFALSVLIDFVTVLGMGGKPDQPSALMLVLGVPWSLFFLVLLVELGLRRGTPGPNRYGADPLT